MPDTFVNNVNMLFYLAPCWLGNIAAFLWTVELDTFVFSFNVSTQTLPAVHLDMANLTNVILKCLPLLSLDIIHLLGRKLDIFMLVVVLLVYVHLGT